MSHCPIQIAASLFSFCLHHDCADESGVAVLFDSEIKKKAIKIITVEIN